MRNLVSLIVLSWLVCTAIGAPVSSSRNSMLFYQQRPVYYNMPPQYYPAAHQAMLVHYGDPAGQYASRRSGQATNEVSAFAAGDTIGAGTYIQDEEPVYESEPQQAPGQLEDGDTLAVAEAYPDAPADDEPANDVPASDNEIYQADTGSDDIPAQDEIQPEPVAVLPAKKKAPKELAAEPVAEVPSADEPAAEAAPAPVVPQKKKKVELVDAEEDDSDVPFNSNAPRPSGGGGSGGQWPLNSFFPMNFGSTSGGAIAVANSFSTGKGGTASSHATAYGSPAGREKKRRLTQQ